MNIHYNLFIIMLIFAVIMKINNGNVFYKKLFCIVTGGMYFFISAFRGYYVGCDTGTYYGGFLEAVDYPLSDYIRLFVKKEYFYNGFVWIMSRLTDSFTWVLVVVAALFISVVFIFIYKYSKDPCLSVIILLALNLMQFSMTGIRQTMAISFTLLAYMLLKKDKYIFSLILIIVASQFHKSALIFLIIFAFRKIKLKNKTMLFLIASAVPIFIFRSKVANLLLPLIGDRGYTISDTGGGETMMFVVFVLFSFYVIMKNLESLDDIGSGYAVLTMYVGLFFEILVPTQNIFFRLAFYFLIIYIEEIPNIIYDLKGNTKFYRPVFYVLLIIQYWLYTWGSSGIMYYYFFWE